jgi:hypothetical protein
LRAASLGPEAALALVRDRALSFHADDGRAFDVAGWSASSSGRTSRTSARPPSSWWWAPGSRRPLAVAVLATPALDARLRAEFPERRGGRLELFDLRARR